MNAYQQQVRLFLSEGGYHVWVLFPLGWTSVGMAMRSGFSRRAIAVKASFIAATLSLAAGLISEQLVHRSARMIAADLHLTPSHDLLVAIEQSALIPRLFGVTIAVFAVATTVFGMVRRRLAPVPELPAQSVRWRLAASTALLFTAGLIAVPNLIALCVAILVHSLDGALEGGVSAAVGLAVACAGGVLATLIREGSNATAPPIPNA
jgi:hypothetical protein